MIVDLSNRGRSPCKLMTISCFSEGSTSSSAAKILSEPEGKSGSVKIASPPSFFITSDISGSPHATITLPRFAFTAICQTRTIIGIPFISARGLLGSLVEFMRQGIRIMGLLLKVISKPYL